MTKKEVADLLITNKAGGNTANFSKYDRRDFYNYIEIAFDDSVGKARRAMGNEYLTADFVKSYKITQLYYDSFVDETFFVLPCSIVNNGLISVSPPQGADFIIQAGEETVYNDLESGIIIDNRVVEQFANRCYIKKSGKLSIPIRIKVIPSGNSYADGEQLPIPTDFADYFFSRALELSEGQTVRPYKKTNDNNPQTA